MSFCPSKLSCVVSKKKSKSITSSPGKIEQFIGIHMFMSIVHLPAFYMNWAIETRYPPVAGVMSIARHKRYVRTFTLVTVQNAMIQKTKTNFIKYNLLDHVWENCILLELVIEHSIDEQIISAKTSKTYNLKKLKKFYLVQGIWYHA